MELRRKMTSFVIGLTTRRSYHPMSGAGGWAVDLRSDTVTTPGAEMRAVMDAAAVGDVVLNEDPTVKELEERCAVLFGMEDALFVPSGTMGNLLAVLSHCWERSSEFIVGSGQHIHKWEQGGAAQFGGVASFNIPNLPDGTIPLDDIREAIRDPDDVHYPRTRLICLENTHNGSGGRILSPEYTKAVWELGSEFGLAVHMDGARIMNAAVASTTPVSDLLRHAHSVSMCLSKAGQLAAAGLYAIEHASATLSEDHRRAQSLAQGIRNLGVSGVEVAGPVETNIVMISTNAPAALVAERLLEGQDGVACFPFGTHRLRWVTHNGVSDYHVNLALDKLKHVVHNLPA